MTSTTHDGSVGGGIAHAESPECTPASSTCSMTPPIRTSPVWSRTASTSTSTAPARKRAARRRPADPHAPADQALAGVVAHRVDVDLDCVGEEAVDEHGPLGRQTAFAAQDR